MHTQAIVVALAIVVPVLVALLVSDDVRKWVRGKGSIRQTLSNAGVGVVFLLTQLALRGALLSLFHGVTLLVPWKLSESVWAYGLTFVLLDAVYYIQHRLEHSVPLLWAIHSVHHQSNDYNLSVSFRVGALASLSTFLFHSMLALAGVATTMYAAAVTVHGLLLFTLHSRTKFTLGPGRLFNAPVFHRVHHGADVEYIDKNFGGVFLLFDRLFGTFAPYNREPSFGVKGEASPIDPLAANVAPFQALAESMRREKTISAKVAALFVRPKR